MISGRDCDGQSQTKSSEAPLVDNCCPRLSLIDLARMLILSVVWPQQESGPTRENLNLNSGL